MADAGTGQGNYLYERLTEKAFQRLCAALLAHVYPGARCYPVGHSDGGRDMTRTDGDEAIVYQVKWASRHDQNPVAWLRAAVRQEADNIRRLVADGATRYVLITSVAGTAVPGRGSMDRLDVELARHARDFGIPMHVWWRCDIDARVDAAPTELKWAHADMLAGHDLVRYFVHGTQATARDQALRTLVMKVMATQWEEDSKVKFKQVELTTHDLDDLFIDVEATRASEPRSLRARTEQLELGEEPADLTGAAQYLLHTSRPFTLVRGEPGQGKSTLSQYVCQRHRAAYLNETDDTALAPAAQEGAANARVALRVDLQDYAAWLVGQEPFADEPGTAEKGLRRDGHLEHFLAVFLTAHSGGLPADTTVVHDLLARLPVLVVLDGLDEVASASTRACVVSEIDGFAARLSMAFSPQMIVTTRPNTAELAEPSGSLFETITLTRLSPELRSTYLHKWARARAITGQDLTELERTFKHRSAEPHIAQLADNPMQLTILLYLMQRRANSVPNSRTALYTSYMETFLDREAAKTPAVHRHRADLEEVTAFLGWHLQARAEAENGNGQLPTRELLRAIMNYLFDVQKDASMFSDLFTAVTDRVWALTSKVQGTFEFDVQPLREYFAARYLYEYAGADQRGFDTGEVLRSMVRRGYWLNTLRFYAGFANPNELGGMVEVLEEERDARMHPGQVRTAAWNLLADGVFTGRRSSQNRAAELFLDDLSVRLIEHGLTHRALPDTAGDRGGNHLAAELRALVAKEPDCRATAERVQLAWRLDPAAFDAWWHPHMLAAVGTGHERTWLGIASTAQSLNRVGAAIVPRLALADAATAAAALAAGAQPEEGSAAEHTLLRTVLAGHASAIDHPVPGYAGDVLQVLHPAYFTRRARARHEAQRSPLGYGRPQHLRADALLRLRERDTRFSRLRQSKISAGQTNTTALWGGTARAVGELFGPCWLGAEIAIIGAATDPKVVATDGEFPLPAEAFGPHPDYGHLLHEVRDNRANSPWWTHAFATHTDSLSRATWVLALISVADQDIALEHLERLDDAVSRLPDETLSALRLSSSRIGSAAYNRPLSADVLATAGDRSLATVNLLTHHVRRDRRLSALDESTLAAMARYGRAAWPAQHALSERMKQAPSRSLLDGLKAFGPRTQSPSVPTHSPYAAQPGPERAVMSLGDPDAVAAVLDAPFDYPMDWLLAAVAAAERSALHSDTAHLRDVASIQRWFTPHDR
ncbi:NACHT domain-containing protein [Streptomyces sp. NPDC005374]|uniref:NACHT domain-containing protein n=1 Tax=Streptomyces sp. NPDC005374 TaxID=3364713 RepID=UPI00369EFA87